MTTLITLNGRSDFYVHFTAEDFDWFAGKLEEECDGMSSIYRINPQYIEINVSAENFPHYRGILNRMF